MLTFQTANGYEFFLGHLISAIVLLLYLIWATNLINKKIFDKALHTWGCLFITFVLLHVMYFAHWPWWISPIVAMIVGIGKEFYDLYFKPKHLFDWKDIWADFLGTGVVCFVYVFSFLLS